MIGIAQSPLCKLCDSNEEMESAVHSALDACGADIGRPETKCVIYRLLTATAGSDVVQSGRPIFDDFFQHLWPYIGNNTANVVFQMVKRLWLIRIDQ
ncbi:hypothetical protein TNCV_77931 [Trichonephila clavipes]|nr:hypothetical protein TNCV_77931 [Trichonephila clavipes]